MFKVPLSSAHNNTDGGFFITPLPSSLPMPTKAAPPLPLQQTDVSAAAKNQNVQQWLQAAPDVQPQQSPPSLGAGAGRISLHSPLPPHDNSPQDAAASAPAANGSKAAAANASPESGSGSGSAARSRLATAMQRLMAPLILLLAQLLAWVLAFVRDLDLACVFTSACGICQCPVRQQGRLDSGAAALSLPPEAVAEAVAEAGEAAGSPKDSGRDQGSGDGGEVSPFQRNLAAATAAAAAADPSTPMLSPPAAAARGPPGKTLVASPMSMPTGSGAAAPLPTSLHLSRASSASLVTASSMSRGPTLLTSMSARVVKAASAALGGAGDLQGLPSRLFSTISRLDCSRLRHAWLTCSYARNACMDAHKCAVMGTPCTHTHTCR